MNSRSEIKRITALDPHKVIEEIERLRAKLKVAEKALEYYSLFADVQDHGVEARKALSELRKV